jgi:hypothetical protein
LKYDKNTFSALSEDYFKLLQKNNINSELININANRSFRFIVNNKEALELGKSLVN